MYVALVPPLKTPRHPTGNRASSLTRSVHHIPHPRARGGLRCGVSVRLWRGSGIAGAINEDFCTVNAGAGGHVFVVNAVIQKSECGWRRLEKAMPFWLQAQARVEAALGVETTAALNDLLDVSSAKLGT